MTEAKYKSAGEALASGGAEAMFRHALMGDVLYCRKRRVAFSAETLARIIAKAIGRPDGDGCVTDVQMSKDGVVTFKMHHESFDRIEEGGIIPVIKTVVEVDKPTVVEGGHDPG